MKFLKSFKRLANADEFNRNAGDCLDGKSRAAASVAVELRQNDAVKFKSVVKRRSAVDRVLTCHGVDDKINLIGLYLALNLVELGHQFVVDVKTSSRV